MTGPDHHRIAAGVLELLDGGRQGESLTGRHAPFTVSDAYRVAAELRGIRTGRGETPVGRKIGFTNRAIWPEYGVFQPIWGDMYDSTVHLVEPGAAARVTMLPEPRIEPEIVLGLERDLHPGMSLTEISEAVAWVAHGFEIVQSIYPGWQFAVPDCVADGGLHGRLFRGQKQLVPMEERAGLLDRLPGLSVALYRNDEKVDEGQGSNVLDGPIQALAHLIDVLADDPHNPPVKAGEIVTTGTMTKAFPVRAGERWATRIDGLGLPGMLIEIE